MAVKKTSKPKAGTKSTTRAGAKTTTRTTSKGKTTAKKKPTRKAPARRPLAKKVSPQQVEQKNFNTVITKVRKNLNGQHVFVLTIPWEAKEVAKIFGAKWHPDLRQFLFEGDTLPKELEPYTAERYSLEAWVQDELNSNYKQPPVSSNLMKPRKHQQVGIKKIMSAATAGWRGFVLADTTGVGKSLTAIIGAYGVAKLKGFTENNPAKLLIISPKAVLPHWRNTVRFSGVNNMRIVVINYDQAKKLLNTPEQSLNAVRTKTKNRNTSLHGLPTINWDIIIADESHKLKNVSQRSNSFNRIARYADEASKAPFVLWLSATVGQAPLELGYLAPLVAQIKGTKNITMKEWGAWLIAEGFAVKAQKSGGGYSWVSHKKDATSSERAATQKIMDEDIQRLSEILFSDSSPSIRRRPEDIAGWPEQNIVTVPTSMTRAENTQYVAAWEEFRKFMHLNPRGKNPAGGLAATLRFRQKASLITAPHTAEYAVELLDNNYQTAISVQFIETLDTIRTILEKKGYTVAEFSGRNTNEREQERLKFQKGEAQVILFTVVEGISLHANEQLPDNSKATSSERALLVHDMRYSGIDMVQINGRTHRDGENSTAWYMYSEGTIEEKILRVMLNRIRNMGKLQGDQDITDEIFAILDGN